MQLLIATSNPHKIEEIRAIFAPMGVEAVGLNDLGMAIPEPIEDGETFEENARIKARWYARATGRRCLADDSGLEVDALNGSPGVLSARYAVAEGPPPPPAQRDRANNEKLLKQLEGVPRAKRTARFVCAMCVCDSDGTILAESRGIFEGVIALEPRGSNGFGYDPLLMLPAEARTSAELSAEEKNARSHRGAAARMIAETIKVLK